MPLSRVTLVQACRATTLALLGPVLAVAAVGSTATGASAVPVGGPVVLATVPGTPWEIAVSPLGGAYVVERDGDVVRLDRSDRLVTTPALARTAIPHVRKLLGLALAPDFASSRLAYLYVAQDQTTDPDGAGPANGRNGIWRLRADGAGGETFTVVDQVLDGIPSDGNHDGGRMVFGPDGALYVTTGDIHQPSRPQDPDSLNGKILRLAVPATGPLTGPADNPWAAQGGSAAYVWSLGHRHPQGLAFDAAGRLWETEHGPTGEQHGAAYPGGNGKTGRDELNLVVRGGNYGWPLVSGPETGPGLVPPVAVAGDSPSWAPGDLAVGADGSLWAPFLSGARLHRFDVRGGALVGQGDHLTDQGRLRVAVARGSDLLVAQDSGSGARIMSIPLGAPVPGGSDAATPPAPEPAPAPAPAAGADDLPTYDAPPARVAVRDLARATAKVLREAGRARLLRTARRPLAAAALVPPGRTRVEVHVGTARGPVLLTSDGHLRVDGPWIVPIQLAASEQAVLRRSRSPFLVVVVRHRSPGAALRQATVRVRVDRRHG